MQIIFQFLDKPTGELRYRTTDKFDSATEAMFEFSEARKNPINFQDENDAFMFLGECFKQSIIMCGEWSFDVFFESKRFIQG